MSDLTVSSGQYKDVHEMMQALMALPPAKYIPLDSKDFNPAEGYEIGMNRAGITRAASAAPIQGTYGLASCMGVTVCTPSQMTGGLVHLAQGEDNIHLAEEGKAALTSLLAAARDNPSNTIEVRISGPMGMGGLEDSFIKDILNILNDVPNLRILSADFKDKPYAKDVGIDTRRWEEGLLKGSNTSGLGFRDLAKGEEFVKRFLEGAAHAVDITSLPSAPYNGEALFDARGLKKGNGLQSSMEPPAATPEVKGQAQRLR